MLLGGKLILLGDWRLESGGGEGRRRRTDATFESDN